MSEGPVAPVHLRARRYTYDERVGANVTIALVMDGRAATLVADVTADATASAFVVRRLGAGTYIVRLSLHGADGTGGGTTLSTFRLV